MSEKPKFRIKKKGPTPDPVEETPKIEEPSFSPETEEADLPDLKREKTKETSQNKSRDERFAEKYGKGSRKRSASNSGTKNQRSRKPFNFRILYYLLGFLFLCALAYFSYKYFSNKSSSNNTLNQEELVVGTNKVNQLFSNQKFLIEKDILRNNLQSDEFFKELKLASGDSDILARGAFNLGINRMNQGDKVSIFKDTLALDDIKYIVLEPKSDIYNYYLFSIDDDLKVEKVMKEVLVKEVSSAAIIEQNMTITFNKNKLDYALINHLEEAFSYSIDFFDVKDGDRFKIVYDREYIEGKANKIRKVKALFFEKDSEEFYAFPFESKKDFFNEFGQNMKKYFLKSPLKYGGIITSGYGMRINPIYNTEQFHEGTDYAAPEGTEILAVADGRVVVAGKQGKSGIFVKIKHDQTYETQYLHMQRHAPGIKNGTQVKQGQLIGYVGMTGSATGPHVCYRFKKNGKQVDHLKENSAKGKGLNSTERENFKIFVDKYTRALQKVQYF